MLPMIARWWPSRVSCAIRRMSFSLLPRNCWQAVCSISLFCPWIFTYSTSHGRHTQNLSRNVSNLNTYIPTDLPIIHNSHRLHTGYTERAMVKAIFFSENWQIFSNVTASKKLAKTVRARLVHKWKRSLQAHVHQWRAELWKFWPGCY